MFNTISGNILKMMKVYFLINKMISNIRGTSSIFDLALGIETVENILKSERKAELENHLAKLIRKNKTISSKASDFNQERVEILQKPRNITWSGMMQS
jgi:hypothetical protein